MDKKQPTPPASTEALQVIDGQIAQYRSQLPYQRDQAKQAEQAYHETLGAIVGLQRLRSSLVTTEPPEGEKEPNDA